MFSGGSPVTRHMSAAASTTVSCNKPEDTDQTSACTSLTRPASESPRVQQHQSVSSDADLVQSTPEPQVSRRKQPHPCKLQSPASLKKVAKLGSEKAECQPSESGDVVWAKLGGYPWWPGLVHGHPESGNHVKGKGKSQMVHIWFFSHPPTRSWIKEPLVKPFDNKAGFYIGKRYIKTSFQCRMYAEKAENALGVPREQRFELASPADATEETPTVAVTPQADTLPPQDPEESKKVEPATQTKPEVSAKKKPNTTTDNPSSKPRKRQPSSAGTKTASKKMKKMTTAKQELSVLKQESAMPEESSVMEGREKAESSVSSQQGTFSTSDVVWAKVLGYPWWPGLVCVDPITGTHLKHAVGKELKIHVAFFGETPTRTWIPHKFVKPFTDASGLECGGRFFATSARCRSFAKQATDAVKMSSQERLSLVSVSGSTASAAKEGLFGAAGDSIPPDQNEAVASSGKGGKRKRSQPKSKSKPASREPQNASRVETDNLSPRASSSSQQSLIPSFFQSSPRSADSNSPDVCKPPGKELRKTGKSKGLAPTKTGKPKLFRNPKPQGIKKSKKSVETSLSPELKRKKTSPSLLPYTSPVMKANSPSQLTQSPKVVEGWKQASPEPTQSPLATTHSIDKTGAVLGRLGMESPAQGVIPSAMDPCLIEESRSVLATGEGIPLVNFNTDSPEGAKVQLLSSPKASSVTYEADAETEKTEASQKQTKTKRPTKIERMNKWMCGAKNVNRGRSKEDRAKLQYQLATRRNQLRYEHQVRTGEYDPQRREKEKKLKKMRFKSWRPKTKEEYQEMRQQQAILRHQDKVNTLEFLKTEQKMLQLLVDIQRSLSVKNKNETRCVELLNELQSLPMRPLLIIKNPEVVYNISRIFGYPDKAVREKAETVYDKFMAMFGVPENQTFLDVFNDAVGKFQDNNERERNRAVERSQGIGYSSSESDSDAWETAASGSEATNDDNDKETEYEDAEDNGTDAGSLEEMDTSLVRPEDEVSESNVTDLSMDENEEPIPQPDSTQQVNLVPGANGGSLNKLCDSFGSVEQLFDRVAQVLRSSGSDGDLEELVTDQNLDNTQGPAGEPSMSNGVQVGGPVGDVANDKPSSPHAAKKTRKSSKKQSKQKTVAVPKTKGNDAMKVHEHGDAKDTNAKRKRGPMKGQVPKRMKPVQQATDEQPADATGKQDEDVKTSTNKTALSAKQKLKLKSARKWKPPSAGATAQVLGTLTVIETTASDNDENDEEKKAEKVGPDAVEESLAQNSEEQVGTLTKQAQKKPRKKVFKTSMVSAKKKSGKEFSVSGSHVIPTMTGDMMEELEEILDESQAIVNDCTLVIMDEHLREIETPNKDLETGTNPDCGKEEMNVGKELEAINQRLWSSTQRLLAFEKRMRNGDAGAGSTDETEIENTTTEKSKKDIGDDGAEKSPTCSRELVTASSLSEKSASDRKAKKAQKGHKKTAANKKKYVPPKIETSDADAGTKEKTSCEVLASQGLAKKTFSAPQKKSNKDEINAPVSREKESCPQQDRNDSSPQEDRSALSPNLTRRRKKQDEDQLDSSPEMMRSKPNLISSVFKSFSQAVRGGLGLSPEDKRRGRRKFTKSPRGKDGSGSSPKAEKQKSDKETGSKNAEHTESNATKDATRLETSNTSTGSKLRSNATDSDAVETTSKLPSSPAPVAAASAQLNNKPATEPDSPGFDFSQSSAESEPDLQGEVSKGPFEEEDIFKTVPCLKESSQSQQSSSPQRSPRLVGMLQAVANLSSERSHDAKTETADLNLQQSPRLNRLSAPPSPPMSPDVPPAETNKVDNDSLIAVGINAEEEPPSDHPKCDSNHSPRRSPRFAGTHLQAVATKEVLKAEEEENPTTPNRHTQTIHRPEKFSPRRSPRVCKHL